MAKNKPEQVDGVSNFCWLHIQNVPILIIYGFKMDSFDSWAFGALSKFSGVEWISPKVDHKNRYSWQHCNQE